MEFEDFYEAILGLLPKIRDGRDEATLEVYANQFEMFKTDIYYWWARNRSALSRIRARILSEAFPSGRGLQTIRENISQLVTNISDIETKMEKDNERSLYIISLTRLPENDTGVRELRLSIHITESGQTYKSEPTSKITFADQVFDYLFDFAESVLPSPYLGCWIYGRITSVLSYQLPGIFGVQDVFTLDLLQIPFKPYPWFTFYDINTEKVFSNLRRWPGVHLKLESAPVPPLRKYYIFNVYISEHVPEHISGYPGATITYEHTIRSDIPRPDISDLRYAIVKTITDYAEYQPRD